MQKLIKQLKKATLVLALSVGLALPVFSGTVHADLFGGSKDEACAAVGATNSGGNCDTSSGGALDQSQSSLGNTIKNVINLFTIIVGVMSVIMIIISGVRFVTSNGDSNHITAARNTFIYALVGLVIVAFAQVIVKLILTKIS